MELVGIEIQNFRSIGEAPVQIFPMKKCNILIGKNNVGKSNVIRAFQWLADIGDSKKRLKRLDRNGLSQSKKLRVKIFFEGVADDKICSITKITKIFFTFLEKDDGTIVVEDNSFGDISNLEIANALLSEVASQRWTSRQHPETYRQIFVNQYGLAIFNTHFQKILPKIEFIPQFRQILEGDTYEFNGKNLIRELEKFQHPPIGQESYLERFEKIQKLLQELLHLPVKLDIPFGGKQIAVTNNGLRLSLEEYGTGVHELIILAAAILSIDDKKTICCIEEPEIHLHPSLQREFIEFITKETEIRYLISTHSPTLINVQSNTNSSIQDDIQVFHLQSNNGNTVGGPVLENDHALVALSDLGVRASDILQSNSIVWVEGPSDRIYLNRWLELLEPNLIEGLHYSVMFYGGRLLSHLGVSRDGQVPDELIDVLKVNQRAIVIMDSDKDKSLKRINDTKKRIRQECENTQSICWITEGREIENYIHERIVNATFHDELKLPYKHDMFERFEARLDTVLSKQIKYADNKVKYARMLAENFTVADITGDLQKQLNSLIKQIWKWNE